MKPGGNAGPVEGVLQHAKVGLGRAQQNRHLVEWHAAGRFLHQPAGNLDGLAAFARGGEQRDRIVRGRRCWRFSGEQIRLQRGQRGQRPTFAAGGGC